MAVLDRRLLQFIEMLTDIGMDWLAFELIEGVRRGREPTETEEILTLARDPTRTGHQEELKYSVGDGLEVQPILGDAQLNWAVEYVDQRLEAILAEMAASFGALDALVASRSDTTTESRPGPTIVVLLSADEERKLDQNLVREAQARLPTLQQSLRDWLTSAQSSLD